MTHKYYAGLSRSKTRKRRKEIAKRKTMSWKNPNAYKQFPTDAGVKTKPSQYTRKWKSLFPSSSSSLKEKARQTGVPVQYLRKSFNRGLAAWRTGHRPGATQSQWGYARVHSMLLCGKTYWTTDADIVRDAKRHSRKAAKWWRKQRQCV